MKYALITTKDTWEHAITKVPQCSVYASWEWVAAAAVCVDQGMPQLFYVEDRSGDILLHPYIRRQIPGTNYFDLVSPFDFGGFWLSNPTGPSAAALIAATSGEWGERCKAHNVVSEFVRLHPRSAAPAGYTLKSTRDSVVIDLSTPETLAAGLSAKLRTDLRKVAASPLHLDSVGPAEFLALYRKSVNAKGRSNYYLFPDEWLGGLSSVRYVGAFDEAGQLCSAHTYVCDWPHLFYFLAASEPDLLEHKPNDCILWATAQWAQAEGYETLYLGGGSPRSLMHYKEKWSTLRVPYWTARRVFLPSVYQELASEFFPAYRGGL